MTDFRIDAQPRGRARPVFPVMLAAIALIALVALLGLASQPPAARDPGFAPAEAQRNLEDWRGNSAHMPSP